MGRTAALTSAGTLMLDAYATQTSDRVWALTQRNAAQFPKALRNLGYVLPADNRA